MTIESTHNRISHVIASGVLEYAYDFLVLDEKNLDVYIEDVLISTSEYTVTGIGNQTGGSIIFNSPQMDQAQLLIIRILDLTQLTNYRTYDKFPAGTHELALDRLTMIDQQQQDELKRCIKIDSDDPIPPEIALPPYDPGKGLMWDEGEVKLVNTPYNMIGYLEACQAAQAAAELAAANAAISETNAAASELAAATSAANALASENRAYEWANNQYDDPVVIGPNEYSAYHWSVRASQWSDHPYNTEIPDNPGRYSAKHWAQIAQEWVPSKWTQDKISAAWIPTESGLNIGTGAVETTPDTIYVWSSLIFPDAHVSNDANGLILGAGGTDYWRVATNGNLLAIAAGNFDIGSSVVGESPRVVHAWNGFQIVESGSAIALLYNDGASNAIRLQSVIDDLFLEGQGSIQFYVSGGGPRLLMTTADMYPNLDDNYSLGRAGNRYAGIFTVNLDTTGAVNHTQLPLISSYIIPNDLNQLVQKKYVDDQDSTILLTARGYTDTEVAKKMHWQGVWGAGTYVVNDVVRDGDWTMIANKTTPDRPAPQPSGDPVNDLPDTPAWAEISHAGVVWSGHQYELLESGWIQEIDVWVPQLTANHNYRILLGNVTDPDPNNHTWLQIEEPVLIEDQWTTVAINPTPYSAGTKIIVVLDALNSGADTPVIGGWGRAANSNNVTTDPGTGNWGTRNNEASLRVNKTDLDSNPRGTELLSMVSGTTVRFTQDSNVSKWIEWYISADPVDQGTHVSWGSVSVNGTGPSGQPDIGAPCSMDALIPIPDPTDYEELAGYWTTNTPTWATVTGLLRLSGVDQTVPNNAYGVRVKFQRAYVSPDWDLVAVSVGGGDSGGGGGGALVNWSELGTTLAPNTAGYNFGAIGQEVGDVRLALEGTVFLADRGQLYTSGGGNTNLRCATDQTIYIGTSASVGTGTPKNSGIVFYVSTADGLANLGAWSIANSTGELWTNSLFDIGRPADPVRTIHLAQDPVNPLEAATKQYVDAQSGGGGLVNWEENGTTFQPKVAGHNLGATGNEIGDLYQVQDGSHFFGASGEIRGGAAALLFVPQVTATFNGFIGSNGQTFNEVRMYSVIEHGFYVDGSKRFKITTTTFEPGVDNAYDIGTTGDTIRDFYQGGTHYFGVGQEASLVWISANSRLEITGDPTVRIQQPGGSRYMQVGNNNIQMVHESGIRFQVPGGGAVNFMEFEGFWGTGGTGRGYIQCNVGNATRYLHFHDATDVVSFINLEVSSELVLKSGATVTFESGSSINTDGDRVPLAYYDQLYATKLHTALIESDTAADFIVFRPDGVNNLFSLNTGNTISMFLKDSDNPGNVIEVEFLAVDNSGAGPPQRSIKVLVDGIPRELRLF